MKILAAVDGSPYTKRMLAYLAAHDDWLGAHHDYTLLYCEPAVPPRAASVIAKPDLKAYYDDASERVFKPMRTFFARQGLKVTFLGKVGPAADVIAATADKGDFDLLIMGSHGQGSLANLVMGSVATKVLARTKVPVLLIR